MTPDGMRTKFFRLVGLPSSFPRITTAELNDLIWRGICEFCRDAEPVGLRRLGSISLVSGTTDYALPTDFWRYARGEKLTVGGVPLVKISEYQAQIITNLPGSVVSEDAPLYYYEKGLDDSGVTNRRYLGFYPEPGASNTAYFHYLRHPRKIDDAAFTAGSTNYPDIPEWYHPYPVMWAAWEFYTHNPEAPAKDPSVWMQQFQAMAARFARESREDLQGDAAPVTDFGFAASLDYAMPVE